MICGLDGGLWPLFWTTVVICITITYNMRRR